MDIRICIQLKYIIVRNDFKLGGNVMNKMENIIKEAELEEEFEIQSHEIKINLNMEDFESIFNEAGVINDDTARRLFIRTLELQSYTTLMVIAHKNACIWFDPRTDEKMLIEYYNTLKDNIKFIGFTLYEHGEEKWFRWYAKNINNLFVISEKNTMLEEFISSIL